MKTVTCVLAILAAISTAAVAKDLKATVMTDNEMDKVTAGGAEVSGPGPGVTVTLPSLGGSADPSVSANFHAGSHPATLN